MGNPKPSPKPWFRLRVLQPKRVFAGELVNKLLSAAGISEDNALGWKIVFKISQLPSNLHFSANCSFFGQSFRLESLTAFEQPASVVQRLFTIHQSYDTPASRKGVYLFYNLPNNFSRRTRVDRSCIFCGFFRVSRYGIVNQHFIYLASAKSLFWFSLTNWKFSLNVCLFFGFPSVKIKSDDGYQIGRQISSDNHRPILYHVVSFIQWEPTEIIQWVIIFYIRPQFLKG